MVYNKTSFFNLKHKKNPQERRGGMGRWGRRGEERRRNCPKMIYLSIWSGPKVGSQLVMWKIILLMNNNT